MATFPPPPYVFSSLSIHSKPINKCGMSFTVAVKRLIFIKKGRNGHLLGTRGTWLCFDSDDKRTWQLNYVLNTRFSVLFRWWESSLRVTLVVKYMEGGIYGSTWVIAGLIRHPSVSHGCFASIHEEHLQWMEGRCTCCAAGCFMNICCHASVYVVVRLTEEKTALGILSLFIFKYISKKNLINY